MKAFATLSVISACLALVACTSAKPVNMKESRRVVGTENNVRVDAEIFGDQLAPSVTVPVNYDITNGRDTTILIADLLPESSYDPDTQIVTITIGSEVPGQEFLPRLIPIRPGEKKSFSTAARVLIANRPASPWSPRPSALRLRVNFLGNPAPFEQLVSIPERAVRDPELAAKLFPKWVEGNETVVTNTLPMHWMMAPEQSTPAAMPGRRGRPGN
ncbi:MAG TPA: hypothetical protein VKH35_10440 [Thermoanaerobaculia bacterium]|nr:hypothetical protein [Thermoanaerobaculia bacterium]